MRWNVDEVDDESLLFKVDRSLVARLRSTWGGFVLPVLYSIGKTAAP